MANAPKLFFQQFREFELATASQRIVRSRDDHQGILKKYLN
jgi:hypothetical protein